MDRSPSTRRSTHPIPAHRRVARRGIMPVILIACSLLPSAVLGRGWLGVSVQDITPELREAMEIRARSGALVSDVSEGGPAQKVGIEPRDVIVRVDDTPVEDTGDLLAVLGEKLAEERVRITVLRDGDERTFEATLAERAERAEIGELEEEIERELRLAPEVEGSGPDLKWLPGGLDALRLRVPRGAVLGVTVHALDSDLASYFDTRPGRGVVVLRVEPDSPAQRAGMRPGDLVLEINRRSVDSPEQLRSEVLALRPGDDWRIRGQRHGEPIDFRGRIERNGDWPSEPGRFDRPHSTRDRMTPEGLNPARGLRRLERQIERLQERIEALERRLERRGHR